MLRFLQVTLVQNILWSRSFERYLAVTFQAHNGVTLKKAKTVFVIFAFCVTLAVFNFSYTNYVDIRSYSICVVAALHFVKYGATNMMRKLLSNEWYIKLASANVRQAPTEDTTNRRLSKNSFVTHGLVFPP